MKDKTTVIVVVACLVALFAWQGIINWLYPPTPLPEQPPVASEETPARPAFSTDNTLPTGPLADPTTPSLAAPVLGAPTTDPTAPRPREEFRVIENDFLRAEFTSWGGGIRTIELFQYRDNGEGHVVLHTPAALPALALHGLPGVDENAVYALEKLDALTLRMRARGVDGVEVVKTITLTGEYRFSVVVEAIHSPAESLNVVIGAASAVGKSETPDMIGIGWLDGNKYGNLALASGFGCGGARVESGVVAGKERAIRWVAVKSQFFSLLLNAAGPIGSIAHAVIELPTPADWKEKTPPQAMQAIAELAPLRTSGYTQTYEFTYYAGPKEYGRLLALGDGEEEVMHFGFFGVISVLLLRGMNFFHTLLPNYGFAIIMITLIIKIIFWPIQAKSMKSMKAMQKFQPIMAKLREKHKDDPQKMNTEMMKLYKEHKINPFAGCLPMVVQIPVFFAFYTMLRSAIELRGAGFLWIHDLSLPDTIGHVFGFPLNPLPLVMGASMIGQMKLTPTAGDPKQQQMMMFMPLIFLFICYGMSSGLVLYWTVQQFLSIAQQWWTLKQPDAPLPVAAPVKPPAKTK